MNYFIDEDGYLECDSEDIFDVAGTCGQLAPEHIEPLSKILGSHDALLEACEHGARSNHHPACSQGKSGDGNTCECHVGKCQQAMAKAS